MSLKLPHLPWRLFTISTSVLANILSAFFESFQVEIQRLKVAALAKFLARSQMEKTSFPLSKILAKNNRQNPSPATSKWHFVTLLFWLLELFKKFECASSVFCGCAIFICKCNSYLTQEPCLAMKLFMYVSPSSLDNIYLASALSCCLIIKIWGFFYCTIH